MQNPTSLLTCRIGAQKKSLLKNMLLKKSNISSLENWDFEANGKITQHKIAKMIGRGIATIKRHWHNFEDYIEYLTK